MNPFHGLSAFPLTPTDEYGKVAGEDLGRLIDRLASAKVDSIGLLGSTGGYAYLSREERRHAVEVAVDCIGAKVPLIVGVGALRTDMAQDLARDAQAAGADALLLAPMSYTPLTEEEAYQHFAAVAGVTDLPLCIYNNPSTTHFNFSVGLIARLAEIASILAVKMPLPKEMGFASEIEVLRRDTPPHFSIGYSGDWGAADALLAGADAFYSVVAGLLPKPALKLARAAQAGDANEVQRINDHFRPLWDLFKELGSFRVMYAAADLLSLTSAKPPRPILPIADAHLERVEGALDLLSKLEGLERVSPKSSA